MFHWGRLFAIPWSMLYRSPPTLSTLASGCRSFLGSTGACIGSYPRLSWSYRLWVCWVSVTWPAPWVVYFGFVGSPPLAGYWPFSEAHVWSFLWTWRTQTHRNVSMSCLLCIGMRRTESGSINEDRRRGLITTMSLLPKDPAICRDQCPVGSPLLLLPSRYLLARFVSVLSPVILATESVGCWLSTGYRPAACTQKHTHTHTHTGQTSDAGGYHGNEGTTVVTCLGMERSSHPLHCS